MKKYLLLLFFSGLWFQGQGINYPISSKILKNGLKVIVCEKPGNDYVYLQVFYRTGSKDEVPGIRGMAHMFEHMMFRGTKKYPADAFEKNIEKAGGESNASTHNDFTEYHESIPKSSLELCIDMEADRMNNLVVSQEILNTERQVVGEEFRNWMNNWNLAMQLNEYKILYPEGHPYTVNTIGNLDEITAFTAAQCMEFYDKYYSPNNAFVVITGDVKPEDIFALADKYFGPLTKQLTLKPKGNLPDLTTSSPRQNEMPLDQFLQVYSYVIPYPAISSNDYYALDMLTNLVFLDENSLINNTLVKKKHEVLAVIPGDEESRFYQYPSLTTVNFYMYATMGNLKVKKEIKLILDGVKTDGIKQGLIDNYIRAAESRDQQEQYRSEIISFRIGASELYFNDYTHANRDIDNYRKVMPDDLKRVANVYFADDRLHVVNIKPE